MAFKIQSLETMKNISTKMSELATFTQDQSVQVSDLVETLKESVSGKGVDAILEKLDNAVTTNAQAMIQLSNDISSFISTQTSSYTTNEETVSSTLTSVQNAFDSIII